MLPISLRSRAFGNVRAERQILSKITGNPYAIRWSKFRDGERMPFLVQAATGLPLPAPTYWIVSKRRPSGNQANSLHNDLRALMYLYLWADARQVDLNERFEAGGLLTLVEVADL